MHPQEKNIPRSTPKPGGTAAAEGKCPGKHPQTRRNHSRRGRMSWKAPQNQEKPPPQRRNVLENTPKPGETTAAEEECPGKHPKIRRNRRRRGEMSWKAPQNQEKPQLQRGNVPETTLKPGETAVAGRRGSTDATKNAIPIKGRRFVFVQQQ